MIKNLILLLLSSVISVSVLAVETVNNKKLQVYELKYIEREPGIDEYEVTMLVSDRYIRVDEPGEDSGFIIYDNKSETIYSVAHQDKSVLVINKSLFDATDVPVKSKIEYLQLADAPPISGNDVFNYRVYIEKDDSDETCLEVQLVEKLLPNVRKLLKNYHAVIAGQQVRMTDNQISEVQTACFFVDQVYNTAMYYDKGLPIQEWHSTESSKQLVSYKQVEVNENKFVIPSGYKNFSIDEHSKTFIQ